MMDGPDLDDKRGGRPYFKSRDSGPRRSPPPGDMYRSRGGASRPRGRGGFENGFRRGSDFRRGGGSDFRRGGGSDFRRGGGSDFRRGGGSEYRRGGGSEFRRGGGGTDFRRGGGSDFRRGSSEGGFRSSGMRRGSDRFGSDRFAGSDRPDRFRGGDDDFDNRGDGMRRGGSSFRSRGASTRGFSSRGSRGGYMTRSSPPPLRRNSPPPTRIQRDSMRDRYDNSADSGFDTYNSRSRDFAGGAGRDRSFDDMRDNREGGSYGGRTRDTYGARDGAPYTRDYSSGFRDTSNGNGVGNARYGTREFDNSGRRDFDSGPRDYENGRNMYDSYSTSAPRSYTGGSASRSLMSRSPPPPRSLGGGMAPMRRRPASPDRMGSRDFDGPPTKRPRDDMRRGGGSGGRGGSFSGPPSRGGRGRGAPMRRGGPPRL